MLSASDPLQVCDFLKNTVAINSGANATSRQVSCELLLLLAFQRGSLRHFLDWIEMALDVSPSDANGKELCRTHRGSSPVCC